MLPGIRNEGVLWLGSWVRPFTFVVERGLSRRNRRAMFVLIEESTRERFMVKFNVASSLNTLTYVCMMVCS